MSILRRNPRLFLLHSDFIFSTEISFQILFTPFISTAFAISGSADTQPQVGLYASDISKLSDNPDIPVRSYHSKRPLARINAIDPIRVLQIIPVVEAHLSMLFHNSRNIIPFEGLSNARMDNDQLDERFWETLYHRDHAI